MLSQRQADFKPIFPCAKINHHYTAHRSMCNFVFKPRRGNADFNPLSFPLKLDSQEIPLKKVLITLFLIAVLAISIAPAAAQEATEAVGDAAPAFPVTIEHKYGSTTITEAPERVVALGFTDQDALIALGVMPVGIRYWFGDAEDPVFAWADEAAEAIGGEAPVALGVDGGTINFEQILALNPDLIISLYSGITEEEYNSLSAIAPTIAQSGDYIDYGMPWQAITLTTGAAVGKLAEAEALVADLEAQIAAAAEANPDFAGKTVAVAYNFGANFGFYTDQDPRGRFFTQLGFVVPEELVEFAGEFFYADVSAERLDLLDQDLLAFVGVQFNAGGQEAIESDPIFSLLPVVREGRVIYISKELDDALQFNTVLSIPYFLDGIVPEIQAALGSE